MRTDSRQPSDIDPDGVPMPLICDTLAALNDAGSLSVKQLEDCLGLAPRSGYPYTSGRVLDAQQFRQLFRHCPPSSARAVQAALLGYLTDGTGWIATYVLADTDVNGDGVVDTGDVIDGAITAAKQAALTLESARGFEKSGFRQISRETATIMQEHLRLALAALVGASKTIEFLAQRSERRAPVHSP